MMNFDSIRYGLTGGRKSHVLELYRMLEPLAFPGLHKIRVGNPKADGGHVMANDFEGIEAALSLGIGRDISWDLAMAARGIEIYQFDHTVDEPVEVAGNPRLHFHQVGISGSAGADPRMKPIRDILANEMTRHGGDLILKIDIDGYEWEVFEMMPDDILARFRQICLEIHHPLARPSQGKRRARNLGVLRKLNARFAPVHLHANNAGPVRRLCGLEVPKLLEITYVRRDGQSFTPSAEEFPGQYDVPNVPTMDEIPIGKIIRSGRAS